MQPSYFKWEKAHTDVIRDALDLAASQIESAVYNAGISGKLKGAQQKVLLSKIDDYLDNVWDVVTEQIESGAQDAAKVASRAAKTSESMLMQSLSKAESQALTASMMQTIEDRFQLALSYQMQALSKRVYTNSALASKMVQKQIVASLAMGDTSREMAKKVARFIDPNTPGGVSYAANRLARTEINNAYHRRQIIEAQERPWVEGLKWNLSGSHPRADECDEYAQHETKGYDPGVWPVNEVPNKPHPHCFCYLTPAMMNEDDFLKSLYGKGSNKNTLAAYSPVPPEKAYENLMGFNGEVTPNTLKKSKTTMNKWVKDQQSLLSEYGGNLTSYNANKIMNLHKAGLKIPDSLLKQAQRSATSTVAKKRVASKTAASKIAQKGAIPPPKYGAKLAKAPAKKVPISYDLKSPVYKPTVPRAPRSNPVMTATKSVPKPKKVMTYDEAIKNLKGEGKLFTPNTIKKSKTAVNKHLKARTSPLGVDEYQQLKGFGIKVPQHLVPKPAKVSAPKALTKKLSDFDIEDQQLVASWNNMMKYGKSNAEFIAYKDARLMVDYYRAGGVVDADLLKASEAKLKQGSKLIGKGGLTAQDEALIQGWNTVAKYGNLEKIITDEEAQKILTYFKAGGTVDEKVLQAAKSKLAVPSGTPPKLSQAIGDRKPREYHPDVRARGQNSYLGWGTKENISSLQSSLTAEELYWVREYTGSFYSVVNSDLRFGPGVEKLTAERQASIKFIDDAIAKYKLKEDVVVSRNLVRIDWMPNGGQGNLTGTTFIERGYMSTTRKGLDQNAFGSSYSLEIRVPAGNNALFTTGKTSKHAHEEEILLPRGTKFKIVEDVQRIRFNASSVPNELYEQYAHLSYDDFAKMLAQRDDSWRYGLESKRVFVCEVIP